MKARTVNVSVLDCGSPLSPLPLCEDPARIQKRQRTGAVQKLAPLRHFLPLVALFAHLSISTLHAQPAATNYVLSLGGTNGFLELPSGAFNDLEEVTIEGWVKSLVLGTWWNPGQPFGLLNSRRERNLPA